MRFAGHNQGMTVIDTIVQQIGARNIMAISGGRIKRSADGLTVELPVAYGYAVTVTYDEGSDTYTVRRIYRRAGKATIKHEREFVYCDEVGEIAYQASCYSNIPVF